MNAEMPFTNSELTTALRCARQHSLSYGRSLVPRIPPSPMAATSLGTEFHLAAQEYYSGTPAQEILDRLYLEDTQAGNIVGWTFEKYVEWLQASGADAHRKTLGAEAAYSIQTPHGAVQGLVDLVQLDEETGEVVLVDFKTTGMRPAMKARELEYTDQMLHYLLLLQDTYPGTNRIEFRIIPRYAGAGSDWDILPVEVIERRVSAARMEAYRNHLDMKLARAIGQRRLRDTHPVDILPTRDHDCPWRCPFANVCRDADENRSIWDAILLTDFVEGNPLERYEEF